MIVNVQLQGRFLWKKIAMENVLIDIWGSKILNLREGSYSHAKLSLYTVYEYVYLQVQAIPHD